MRKISIYFLLAATLFCSSCIHIFFEQPSVTLTRISANPTLQGVNLHLGMDVTNPNSYDLKLETFTFNLVVNGTQSAIGQIESPVLLPGKSTSYVEIPVKADMSLIGICISAIIQGRDLKYKVEGDALVKALLGTKSFHFNREGAFTREMLKR